MINYMLLFLYSGNMSQYNGILLPPVTPTTRFECNVCGKLFRKKGGLTRHLNIITKYNILHPNIDILPESTIRQFKGILVHYIHKRLLRGHKQLGKQTVSVPATESQFYAVFNIII